MKNKTELKATLKATLKEYNSEIARLKLEIKALRLLKKQAKTRYKLAKMNAKLNDND